MTNDTNANSTNNPSNVSTPDAPNLKSPSLPPNQDAGQSSTAPDLHTHPPTIELPPTSNTGVGFSAPDAGVSMPTASSQNTAGQTTTPMSTADLPPPSVGNVDRDALAGQNKGAGSQVDAESVSST